MTSPPVVSFGILRSLGACFAQRTEFAKLFGLEASVEITLERALELVHVFEWDWAGEVLLSRQGRLAFALQSKNITHRDNIREAWINDLASGSLPKEWLGLDRMSWRLRMMEMAILFVKLAEEYGLAEK